MYDRHLERISNRPGESIQVLLARKIFEKFIHDSKNEQKRVLVGRKSRQTFIEEANQRNSDNVDDSHHQAKRSLLEVGTGSGRMLPIVLNQDIQYVGIEPTASMRMATLQNARKLGIDDSKFRLIDVRLPNVPKELADSFDYVYLSHVLEHASSPHEARIWLENLSKALKKDGYIFVISPNVRDYGWRFWDVDWSHGWPTTPNNISEILEDLNFKILATRSICGWSTSRFIHLLTRVLLLIYPEEFLDWFFKKSIRVDLLGSGFANAFLRRNCYVIAKKNQ